MKASLRFVLLALLTFPLMASEPAGTVPRNSAAEYQAHSKAQGAGIGARVLTSKEVHHAFSTDLNECCVVVEVAIYPATGQSLNVSLNDFSLQVGNTDRAAKPSSARLLAAQLQERNAAPDQTGVTVYPEAHVGYEAGIDPITGRRVHGVDYGGGVGVGVGPNRDPNLPMPPASTPRDRKVMALELGEKGLPQGETAVPVAGYFYFALSKKDRKAVHHLKYTLNGRNLSLNLN
jgi:hypothetical protein